MSTGVTMKESKSDEQNPPSFSSASTHPAKSNSNFCSGGINSCTDEDATKPTSQHDSHCNGGPQSTPDDSNEIKTSDVESEEVEQGSASGISAAEQCNGGDSQQEFLKKFNSVTVVGKAGCSKDLDNILTKGNDEVAQSENSNKSTGTADSKTMGEKINRNDTEDVEKGLSQIEDVERNLSKDSLQQDANVNPAQNKDQSVDVQQLNLTGPVRRRREARQQRRAEANPTFGERQRPSTGGERLQVANSLVAELGDRAVAERDDGAAAEEDNPRPAQDPNPDPEPAEEAEEPQAPDVQEVEIAIPPEIVQQWREIGFQWGLEDDNAIARMLLQHYEDVQAGRPPRPPPPPRCRGCGERMRPAPCEQCGPNQHHIRFDKDEHKGGGGGGGGFSGGGRGGFSSGGGGGFCGRCRD